MKLYACCLLPAACFCKRAGRSSLNTKLRTQVDFCRTLFIVSENSFITVLNVFALIV